MDTVHPTDIWGIIMVIQKRNQLSSASESFDIIRTQMQGFIDDPAKLIEFLELRLKPKKFEKKENGEVFTSPVLINEKYEKLEKLYPDIWSNPSRKFLDPTNGIGNYTAVAYQRLMTGLEQLFPDARKRKTHILEKMLYMCELSSKNVEVSKRLFDPTDSYKLNIHKGDFMKLDTLKEWGVEKFDVIIGNPPFQEKDASGDNKLYLSITKKCIDTLKDNGILAFVTPRNIVPYLLLAGKNRFKFDMMYDIKHLAIETCNHYFKNVGSSFLWFILEKTSYVGPTCIEYMNGKTVGSDMITLSPDMKLPKTITPIDISIVSKVTSVDDVFKFKNFVFNGTSRRIRKEHIRKGIVTKQKTDTHTFPIIDTINKTNPFPGIQYYYTVPDDEVSENKLVFSKKGYLEVTIDRTGQYSYSDNFAYIIGNNIDGLYRLFTSDLVNYMIKQFSTSGFGRIVAITMFKRIDVDNDDTIEDIYASYNLTPAEITRIKSFV